MDSRAASRTKTILDARVKEAAASIANGPRPVGMQVGQQRRRTSNRYAQNQVLRRQSPDAIRPKRRLRPPANASPSSLMASAPSAVSPSLEKAAAAATELNTILKNRRGHRRISRIFCHRIPHSEAVSLRRDSRSIHRLRRHWRSLVRQQTRRACLAPRWRIAP